MEEDRRTTWMLEAIELSRRNVRENKGGPFAALIVRDNKVVSRGTNLVTSNNDPTAHAEINAIRDACRSLGTFRLNGCEIVTTCEPCPMCLGAIYWARLDRIYYANSREDAAHIGFDDGMIYREIALPAGKRKIPALRILQVEGRVAFEEWEKKGDKTRY
jgi:tRNA(Arg) A34 adenosine deaminase TadA